MDFSPLYPFGYGKSFTSFIYSDLTSSMNKDGSVAVNAKVTNAGMDCR